MRSDSELLQSYVETGSEEAFATLVNRHLPVVYSAAVRQFAGDTHQAEEAAQSAFTLLAQKAKELRRHPALIGWLYTTTHYTAARMKRSDQRRRRREQRDTPLPEEIVTQATTSDWEQVGPVIDELIFRLSDRDRSAVLLRFFENKPYGEIGRQLGLSENAARMRVDRALESLRTALARRGISSTAAALGAAFATQAINAAPPALALAISTHAAAAATLTGGATIIMTSTYIKIGIVAGIILAASSALLTSHHLAVENDQLRAQLLAVKYQHVTPTVPAPDLSAPLRTNGSRSFASSLMTQPAGTGVEDNRDPTRGLTSLKYFKNVGRATPAAAVQTILWATVHGDAKLPGMIFLNKAALKSTQELMAALPASAKEGYDNPEEVAALFFSKYLLEHIDTVRIQDTSLGDPETAEVKILTGELGPTAVSMQRTPNGWLWKVKSTLIDNARKELIRAPASSDSSP